MSLSAPTPSLPAEASANAVSFLTGHPGPLAPRGTAPWLLRSSEEAGRGVGRGLPSSWISAPGWASICLRVSEPRCSRGAPCMGHASRKGRPGPGKCRTNLRPALVPGPGLDLHGNPTEFEGRGTKRRTVKKAATLAAGALEGRRSQLLRLEAGSCSEPQLSKACEIQTQLLPSRTWGVVWWWGRRETRNADTQPLARWT